MTGCAASHFFSSCVRSTSAGALVGPAAAIAQTAIAPAARQAAATGAINRRLRAHNALTGTSPLKPQVMRNCLPISSPPEDRRCSQAHQEVLECVTSSPAARSDGMKIQLFSDLHLEHSHRHPPFALPAIDADVVVLAGDIDNGTRAIDWAEKTFPDRTVLYVPGNHEYYDADFKTAAAALRARARCSANVRLLDNDELTIDGVRFLGSTLWTDFALL